MALIDENELIQQAQQGNALAFEQLVYRYDRQVLSLAMNFTRNAEDARDIYQEVFLRIYRALPKFRFESKFSTWIHKIVTNVCLTYRSRKRRDAHESLDEKIEFQDGSTYDRSDFLADTRTSERQAMDSQISEKVEKAMESLSPQQKLVFSLRHFQGHKLKEIAVMMECAEGTVKKHLFMANERLRNQLKDVLR